ncbi:hypothetical protein DFH06DRAFT_1121127 [Mycena polygramma]|nr:hypothetical protein DFH06DRAFT_1121127 [Mycena polygramma]
MTIKQHPSPPATHVAVSNLHSKAKSDFRPARNAAWLCIARIRFVLTWGQAKCQQYDWNNGSRHKERCHLFEIDRKLSDEHLKSTESPGHRLKNPTVSLEEKLSLWTALHHRNFSLIFSTVFPKKPRFERDKLPDLGIFLKLVGNGPEYDNRSFIIDKVALIPWGPRQGWQQVQFGFCLLPRSNMLSYLPHAREPYYFHDNDITLPPDFDLHRLITHLNRGITHFHGSFWPLPRRLSDNDFEAAAPPPEWVRYMRHHNSGFTFDFNMTTVATELFCVEKRDGSYTELFKYDENVSRTPFDSRLKTIAEIDATEFKKLLDDSSRRLRMVSLCEYPIGSRYSFANAGPTEAVVPTNLASNV